MSEGGGEREVPEKVSETIGTLPPAPVKPYRFFIFCSRFLGSIFAAPPSPRERRQGHFHGVNGEERTRETERRGRGRGRERVFLSPSLVCFPMKRRRISRSPLLPARPARRRRARPWQRTQSPGAPPVSARGTRPRGGASLGRKNGREREKRCLSLEGRVLSRKKKTFRTSEE